MALKAAAIGRREELVEALILSSFQEAIFKNTEVIRRRQDFDAAYQAGIGAVVDIAQQQAMIVASVLPQLHQQQKKLRSLGLKAIYAKDDINQQINWLFSVKTLSTAGCEKLRQYPRLIQGIQVRLEKLASQIARDRDCIGQLMDFYEPLKSIEGQRLTYELEQAIWDFQWLLEEYRVSLFAQQLKTRVPVSEKRLKKRWLEIDDSLRRYSIDGV